MAKAKSVAVNLEMCGDFILLEPTEEEQAGPRIALPDTYRDEHQSEAWYRVVATGPGGYTREGGHLPMGVDVGDTVLLTPGCKLSQLPSPYECYYLTIQYEVVARLRGALPRLPRNGARPQVVC